MRDIDELLAGVTDVQWNRMTHAYGPATEVPGLLVGLADPDPAVRETALGAFYGTVHHQGDVYASTLAALPFLLRIAADPGRPGRAGVVKLVGSIGGIGWGDDEPPSGDLFRRARRDVIAAGSLWRALLDDPDPEVRAVCVPVLAATTPEAASTLRERFVTDTDPRVRGALVEAVAGLARGGVEVEAAARWLAAVTTSELGPAVRLAALSGLATLGDEPGVPAVDVETALDLLAVVYETGTPTTPAAGYTTDTVIGHVRRRRERADEGRTAPEADNLVRAINNALGDRVDDRVTLLTTLLAAHNWEARLDALYPTGRLIHGWRGPYDDLIRLVAAQIGDPRRELSERAVYELHQYGELAAPAADALADALENAERAVPSKRGGLGTIAWVIEWGNGPAVSPALSTLATLGDLRALPMLRWALERDETPRHAASPLNRYGERAADLVPLLRHLLTVTRHEDVREERIRRDEVAFALGSIGPAAADAVGNLLAVPPTDGVIRALGKIGPAAHEALPMLREQAANPDRARAIAAADALWAVGGDAERALAVYDRFLDGDRFDVVSAVKGLGALGPHAAARADRLRRVLRRKDEHGWLPLATARALWQTVGDPVGVAVLEGIWDRRPLTKLDIATLWGQMGEAAAGTHPRLEAELRQVRRHNVQQHSFNAVDATNDDKLVAACRRVLRKGAG